MHGPIKPLSNRQKRYFISFIDEAKFEYIFLVKNLKPLLSSTITKILLRKRQGFIRCLRIDRDGEFTSHEFNIFCKTNDIITQLIAAYTPNKMV